MKRWISMSICLVLLVLGLFSCRQEVALPLLMPQQLAFSRIVDLSHVIAQDMPTHPGALPPALNRAAPDGVPDMLAMSTRSGSRVTAVGAARLGALEHMSASDLVAPAVAIDMRDLVRDDPAARIDANALRLWERDNGQIPAGSIALIATGWDLRWSTPGAYMNLDQQQRIEAPSIDASGIALLRERGVAGVGIDGPQLAADSPLPAGVSWLVLEDLTNLEQLPPHGTTLVIGALKLQGGDASPARIFAFVP